MVSVPVPLKPAGKGRQIEGTNDARGAELSKTEIYVDCPVFFPPSCSETISALDVGPFSEKDPGTEGFVSHPEFRAGSGFASTPGAERAGNREHGMGFSGMLKPATKRWSPD